jgi:hypothetical protein
VLLTVKEQRSILHETTKLKANWIGYIFRRNCLLQQVIEGNMKAGIEVKGRRGRRRRKLLNDLKERRVYSHLKEEALDRKIWRACFGRGLDFCMTDYQINESGSFFNRRFGQIRFHEKSVRSYNSTLRKIPKGRIYHLHDGGSLQSRTQML